MSILTKDEVKNYVTILNGVDPLSLISVAELIVESPAGSNCRIEKSLRKEQRTIGQSLQTVQLSYWPVYPEEPINLKGRFGNLRSRYRYPIGVSQWESIASGSYFLDETGHLSLNTGNSFDNFGRAGQGSCFSEIKIEYQAGIDFTRNDYEVIELKKAFGLVISAITNSDVNYLAGVQVVRRESYLEGSEQYATGQPTKNPQGNQLPSVLGVSDFLLAPFRKYRPRGLY